VRPVTVSSHTPTWSNYDDYRHQDELYAAPSARKKVLTLGRAGRDPRGLFAAGGSFVALVLTFVPWYKWSVVSQSKGVLTVSRTIFDLGYRGWYLLIPLAAALGVVLGVANALLRAAQKGSVGMYMLMQGLALVTIGLVVAARFLTLSDTVKQAHRVASISYLWPIYGALAAAVVALLMTLASGMSKKTTG
jgi:hypothetical protein